MSEQDPNTPISIDVERFVDFYSSLSDGRGASPSGTARSGGKQKRIEDALRDRLGPPTDTGKQGSYWLGSKSALEEWKSGKQPPRPKPRKVLEAVYVIWKHDISISQEFANRVIVEPGAVELLSIQEPRLEPLPATNSASLLRLKRLAIIPKRRAIINEKGEPTGATAWLDFSEISIVVDPLRPTVSVQIILKDLEANSTSQFGHSKGMTIWNDNGQLKWRLISSARDGGMVGHIEDVQLLELRDESIRDVEFRIEVDRADFHPRVEFPPGKMSDQQAKDEVRRNKELICEQILRKRLTKETSILASGRLSI